MQILRYMVFIWEDYEKEINRLKEQGKEVKTAKQKEFRYPVILPIVYYEGTDNWTAAKELKDRIWLSDEMAEYIPNFSYELIQLNGYSNEELLAHQDEISLIMLFNKLQNLKDIENLKKLLPENINTIVKDTPEYLLTVVADVIRSFLSRMNLPSEETEEVAEKVRSRKMGVLFENMEKLDIQLERRLRKEAEDNLSEAEENLARAEEKVKQTEQLFSLFITLCQENGMSKEEICRKILAETDMSQSDVENYIEEYFTVGK